MSHIHIDIQNLSFGYEPNQPILQHISLHAGEHESIGIIGANGVGKSTLLKLLVGLELGFSGYIRVEEIPVEAKTLSLLREKIGYVFQDSDSQLFMSTAYEDIAFAPRNYGLPEEEVERRVTYALKQVGIPYLRHKQIFKMSGGEKKLVSIATVLAMKPDILLFDEPSAYLDPKSRRNLIKLLNGFSHLKILTSHDLDFVLDTCNRVILISDGKIVADGKTTDILYNKKLLEDNGLEVPFSVVCK